MPVPPSDSPTRTIPPADPGHGPEQVTATIIPSGHEEPHERTATHAPNGEPIHRTRPFDGPDSPTSFPTPDDRYMKKEFIARGGMGEVWTARDRVLNRDVAMKILREDLKDRSFVASRFIEEARITGKLEHPGIPPIHDLGSTRDGLPFIAMKLIKGRTLSDLLANERPELAELLRIFDYVCQAVAAAHEKRVIHRDLKPGNVMVGRFNEVQVMDWGLAKVLAENPTAAEDRPAGEHPTLAPVSIIESDRDPSSHTRAGSLLGTPAYMPPEQAKGEVDRTDTRSDVFALGALLCELLTGRPPYWAATSAEIQAFAVTAHLSPAFERLDAGGADPELIALAKHCLSANQDDRPADAKCVADAIKAYRMGVEARLQRSERDRAAAEARAAEEINTRREAEARGREHQKRRRTQLLLAAAAVLLLAGGGAGAWWADKQAAEKDRIRRDKQAEIDRVEAQRQADSLRQQAERRGQLQRNGQAIEGLLAQVESALKADDVEKALLPLAQIDKRLPDGGSDHLGQRIGQARADIDMLQALDHVDDIIGSGDQQTRTLADAGFNRAFKAYGIDFSGQLMIEEERKRIATSIAIVSASQIRERLLLGLDLWYLHHPRSVRPSWMRKVLDGLDPDPFRHEYRDLLLRGDETIGRAVLDNHPEAFRQPARFATLIGQTTSFPTPLREQIVRRALERYPNDFPLLLTMIRVQENSKEFRLEALAQQFRWSQAAVAVRPNSKVAWRHLGRAYLDKGQLDDAIRCYKKALRLDPTDVNTLCNLGNVLYRKHDPEAAIEFTSRAVAIDPDYSYAHSILGSIYDRMGRYDDAFREFDKAIAIDEKNRVENASLFNNRGYAYLRRGDHNAAIRDFREALRINKDFRLAEMNLNFALEMKKGGREPDLAPPPSEKR